MPVGEPGAGALPLHVQRSGSGPPILLLHGFGANGHTWRGWVGDLSTDHETIVVDLKGFGAAPKPRDGRYAPTDLADAVHRLILLEDLVELTLVGHSLGGSVALMVALRLADDGDGRLSRLVIVAGAAYPLQIPRFTSLARRSWAALAFRLLPKRPLLRHVLRSVVHDPDSVDDEQVAAYADPLKSADARHALLAAAAQIVPENTAALVARLPELTVSTLLVWGRNDRVVPLWVAERLERDLPRARLVVIDHCGHIPPEERPAESLRAVRDFLRPDVSAAAPPDSGQR